MPDLFTPLKLGDLKIPNRVVMAPLTRCRAGETRVPNALMKEYYVQRASAGLIITEATAVDPMSLGYPDTPGIWSDEQTEGWRSITNAVHHAGGRIVLQLWHVGRISHPFYLNGALPVAPSAVAAEGHVALLRPKQDYPTPRALELSEIPAIVEAYRKGAENAKAAGFDGVEIHGANGYLLDQFLQDSTNKRADAYGGSIENRARLMLEVADACAGVWGPGRVGMHLAPRGDAHSMGDSDPKAVFSYVARELGKRKLAFLCTREYESAGWLSPDLRKEFGGAWIANENFTPETAAQIVSDGVADAVAFGKLFIANPDLPARIAKGAAFNAPDFATFYGSGPKGYTDYPALSDKAARTTATAAMPASSLAN